MQLPDGNGKERIMFTYTKEEIKAALDLGSRDALKITDTKIAEMKANPQLKFAHGRLAECREFYGKMEIPSISFTQFNRFYVDGDRAAYEREYFRRRGHLKTWALSLLFDKENKEYPAESLNHCVFCCSEIDKKHNSNCDLCQLVSNGVKYLAKCADLVELSCNLTVKCI